jgi:hypothetical protein
VAEHWAKKDVVNGGDDAVAFAQNADKSARSLRLFEYLKGYADEYLGRAYVLPAAFLNAYTDSETGQVVWNYEVDDGGYLPEGSSPLGLSAFNEDKFQTQDGRFRCFVKYPDLVGADLSQLDPVRDAIQASGVYVAAEALAGFVPTSPLGVLVKVPRPLFDKAADGWGNESEVRWAAFQARADDPRAREILRGEGGFAAIAVHPAPRYPSGMAVPFRSNVDTYGPWYAVGASGKTRAEHDPSLTPWGYGGFAFMNAAATSRVSAAISSMQVGESGEVELAGAPASSLGDTLSAGGPNITNVAVTWSASRVTTRYGFRTYTANIHRFSRGNAERLRRMGLGIGQARRAARAFAKERLAVADALRQSGGGAGLRKFAEDGPKAVKRQSPHDYLVATTTVTTGTGGRLFAAGVTTATAEEALTMIYPDDPSGYRRSAAASLDSLFMPYSTYPFPSGQRDMPQYRPVTAASGEVTRLDLDPWGRPVNVAGFTRNAAYDPSGGLSWRTDDPRSPSGVGEVRGLALRGPLMVAGWGFDTGGIAISGDPRTADGMRVGPVDMRWDEARGVWAAGGGGGSDVEIGEPNPSGVGSGSGPPGLLDWHIAVPDVDTLTWGHGEDVWVWDANA